MEPNREAQFDFVGCRSRHAGSERPFYRRFTGGANGIEPVISCLQFDARGCHRSRARAMPRCSWESSAQIGFARCRPLAQVLVPCVSPEATDRRDHVVTPCSQPLKITGETDESACINASDEARQGCVLSRSGISRRDLSNASPSRESARPVTEVKRGHAKASFICRLSGANWLHSPYPGRYVAANLLKPQSPVPRRS
jgi:hypothetical protein